MSSNQLPKINHELSKKTKDFLSRFPNTIFAYLHDSNNELPMVTSDHLDLARQELGYGTFFTVNGFFGGRRIIDNLLTINSFFVDIDYPFKTDVDPAAVQRFKNDLQQELFLGDYPIPTALVETKRGFHVYWILETPIRINDLNEEQHKEVVQRWRDVQEAILKRYEGDPKAKDPARILRVPETLHLKVPTEPFMVRLAFFNPEQVYKFGEIVDAFLIRGEVPDKWATVVSENAIDEKVKEKLEAVYPRLERRSYKSMLDRTAQIGPGMRNQSLLIIANACKSSGWSLQQTLDHFGDNFYGLGLREIRRTIQSAFEHTYEFGYNNEIMNVLVDTEERAELSRVTSQVLSDNSKSIRDMNNEKQKQMYLSYEHTIALRYPYLKYKLRGDFYDYKDGVYIPLQIQEVQSIFLREMLDDGLLNYRKISSVNDKIACFKSLDYKTFTQEDENPDDNIVNLKNGLLNLKDYTLSSHTPDYLSTVQIPIDYNPRAPMERWKKFVNEVMNDDSDQVRLLAQIAGYSLTSDTRYAKAFIFFGTGANGKSLFTRIISKLVGNNNTSSVNLSTLTKQFGLAGIIGKRLNLIDEISGNYFESNIIKTIISGERMSAEIKHRAEPIEFVPTAKLIFSVNEMPKINDTSQGLYRRFIIIPFEKTFISNPDVSLESKLMAEISGVLNWALMGLKDLRTNGYFTEMQKNLNAMSEFRTDNSPITEFIASEYDPVSDTDAIKYPMLMSELFKKYKDFCYDSGYKPKAITNFSREINHHLVIPGYNVQVRIVAGKKMIYGIRNKFNQQGDTIIYEQLPPIQNADSYRIYSEEWNADIKTKENETISSTDKRDSGDEIGII